MTTPSLPTCEPIGPLAIACYGARGIYRRYVRHCPTCDRRTPWLEKWDGAWYGSTHWCVVCLDEWQDGDRMRRPFRPRWRAERAALIADMWDAAMLPDEYERWTRLDVHRATCNWDGWEDRDCPECSADPRVRP